ncbi:MAG: hypothetical protein L3V56_07410 [Candidatus Magnetoovum sp. WYHC-5]|nr:hypothetical protein [Candidatus Magnetoovum sp. WYHC-5]
MKESCPGSSEIKNPYPEDMKCFYCGAINEIWSDELEKPCVKCGKVLTRQMKETCLSWCPSARECVGSEKYDRLMKFKK